MAPVNCRRCDRYALVLDGHLECSVCREKRIPITGQLLENLEPKTDGKFDYLTERGWILNSSKYSPGWSLQEDDRNTYWTANIDTAFRHQKGLEGEKAWEYRTEHARVFGEPDMVNSPEHYNVAGVEVIDVIEAYAGNNYHKGNVLKYVCRSGHKHNEIEDLRKARWYLDRLIRSMEDEALSSV